MPGNPGRVRLGRSKGVRFCHRFFSQDFICPLVELGSERLEADATEIKS